MSNYTPITDFSVKDALATGNPSKLILGSEVDAEFAAIQTAITSKLDDINALSAETTVDYAADYLAMYDNSTTSTKKVLVDNIRKGVFEKMRLSAFRASSASSTSVPDVTETNLILDSETFDYGSNFSGSTYTVPYTGLYLFSGTIRITGTPAANATLTCYIRINTGNYYIGVANMDNLSNQVWAFSGSVLVSCAAGDTVVLRVHQNAAATFTTSAGGGSFLQGFFIREIS